MHPSYDEGKAAAMMGASRSSNPYRRSIASGKTGSMELDLAYEYASDWESGYVAGMNQKRNQEMLKSDARLLVKDILEIELRVPIKDHPYHKKTDGELDYIRRDAHKAAQAMRGHSPEAENKYLDQVNDAETVLAYRRRGGRYRGE